MSVLLQNSGVIGKSIPSALEISLDPQDFHRAFQWREKGGQWGEPLSYSETAEQEVFVVVQILTQQGITSGFENRPKQICITCVHLPNCLLSCSAELLHF